MQYEGANTQSEQGWLFGTLILETPTLRPRRRGWIPAWAVRRLRPPGPIRRRAWNGCVYTLLQWQEYYGDALGTLYWEQAPPPEEQDHAEAPPTRPPPTEPQPRDAETLLAGPYASGLGGSRAAGARGDDRPATFGPQGDVETAPMQAPPTGGATGAETPGEEPHAEAPSPRTFQGLHARGARPPPKANPNSRHGLPATIWAAPGLGDRTRE